MVIDLVAVSRHLEQTLGVPPLIRINGKAPLDAGWPTGPRKDPELWRRRLTDHKGNVGMVTGGGLVAVDVDLHHPDGDESFQRLRELGLPTQTVTAITGGGGRHYLYRITGAMHSGPLGGYPGIDIKADGGQIVTAPSIHPDTGRAYEWEFSWGPGDVELLDLPARLVALFATGDSVEENRRLDERDEAAVNLLLEHFGGHHPRVHASSVEICRPGKNQGVSATIGVVGPGVTKVFSSNWPGLPAGVYSPHELRVRAGIVGPKVAIPRAPAASSPFVRASSLSSSVQRWIWNDLIPAGELAIAAGREKLGKSTALVWVAARLTRGELPGYLEGVPCDVLFVSAEDHATRVLLPRLDLAGADRDRLFVLNPLSEGFSVQAVHALDAGLGLVVLDPLSVFLQLPAANEHGENATRRALLPFVELAQELECGLVGIRHFNKGSARDNPFDVVMGSRAYSAAARSVLFFTPDPEHRDRPGGLMFARGNLAGSTTGFRYRLDIVEHLHDDGNTGHLPLFVPDGQAHHINLEDALGPEEDLSERERAMEWLREALAMGPVPAKDVERLAAGEDISSRTLDRAKRFLGVVSDRVGGLGADGHWRWSLPKDAQ